MSEDTLNESILNREFNLDTTEETNQEIQIRDMRNQLAEVVANTPDPDAILLSNIDRANQLLDKAQNTMDADDDSNVARMYEVCAQLINAITSAATSVQNSTFGMQKHEYNMKMIEVKEKEIAVKEALARGKLENKQPSGGGTKVVAMSREELLNMIEKEEAEVEVESAGQENPEQQE